MKRWSTDWVKRRVLGVPRELALRTNMLGVVPVIVYQMGKVGSSAVVTALERCWLPVLHVHLMDAEHLRRTMERRRSLGWHIPPVPPHDRLGLRIRSQLINRGGRAKIVTLVRDPLARNLSSYFDHLEAVWHRASPYDHASPETLAADFAVRFPHDEALTWFDDEMLPVTGIDVYDHPFPAHGHRTITTDRFELLILRTELPDEAKSAALAAFVGKDALTEQRANTTAAKPEGAAFEAFRSALRLEPSLVDRVLESRYATHFFTPDERVRLRAKYLQTYVDR